MRWWVRQRPASVTRTSASGALGSGAGELWTRRSRGPWRTAALMADNLQEHPRLDQTLYFKGLRLPRRVAAVEEDRLSRHESRRVGRQIDRQRPDLLGPADPSHRDVARQPLVDPRVRERGIRHIGREPPGSERV